MLARAQRLEYGGVLRIHREHLHSLFLCERHDDVSRAYQCLLVGYGYIVPCLHSGYGRPYAYHPHHGSHHYVCLRHRCCLYEPIHAREHPAVRVLQPVSQILRCLFVIQDRCLRAELSHLSFHEIRVMACSQCSHRESVSVSPHYVKGLCPYGARGPQYHQSFHHIRQISSKVCIL